MSTTSPIFGFVLATTSDTVNVVSQIANNFSSVDSIIGVCHTGTGQLKGNVAIPTPTLSNPILTGTMTGGNIVATTGQFNTITATGGAITVNSLTIGTCPYPTVVGAVGQLLTVSGTAAKWVDNVPNTGADLALSNLASVAINTNLNNFTAGTVTVSVLKATAGTLSGLTSVVSTTGTFSGLNIVGTLNADACNFTGGTVKVASFSVGTYTYPNTVGDVGNVMGVTSSNALVWAMPGNQFQPSIPLYSASVANSCGTLLTVTGGYPTFNNTAFSTMYLALNAVSASGAGFLNVYNSYLYKPANVATMRFEYEITCSLHGGVSTAQVNSGNVRITLGTVTTATGTAAINPLCFATANTGGSFLAATVNINVTTLTGNQLHPIMIEIDPPQETIGSQELLETMLKGLRGYAV